MSRHYFKGVKLPKSQDAALLFLADGVRQWFASGPVRTKQGVRDLEVRFPSPRPTKVLTDTQRILIGITCLHPRMRDCCGTKGLRSCDHIDCPDCGLTCDLNMGC